MSNEEESGFTFVDKRRGSGDGPAAESGAAQPAEAATPAPVDAMREPAEGPHGMQGLPHLSVRDRLLMCIDILNQGAWIALGLVTDPATGKIEQDLAQARVAIDSLGLLAGKIEPDLDEETRRELRNLLKDLQINFVQQSNSPAS